MGRLTDLTGRVVGEWTVVGYSHHYYSGKSKLHMWDCLCSCGTLSKVHHSGLLTNKTKSCGCKQNVTHGDTGTRLHELWLAMKSRSKRRLKAGEQCLVYQPWLDDFVNFKSWALANGYTDELHLCRNGDNGNYEPNNCRWDTSQSNMEEARSKYYIVIDPEGIETEIFNLDKFCREQNLHSGHMRFVASGKRKQHKGWRCRHV